MLMQQIKHNHDVLILSLNNHLNLLLHDQHEDHWIHMHIHQAKSISFARGLEFRREILLAYKRFLVKEFDRQFLLQLRYLMLNELCEWLFRMEMNNPEEKEFVDIELRERWLLGEIGRFVEFVRLLDFLQ